MIFESVISLLGLVMGILYFVRGEVWGLVEGMYAGVVLVMLFHILILKANDNMKLTSRYSKQCPHRIVLTMLKVNQYLLVTNNNCIIKVCFNTILYINILMNQQYILDFYLKSFGFPDVWHSRSRIEHQWICCLRSPWSSSLSLL